MFDANPLEMMGALIDWIGDLSPDMLFLFGLPFVIAALGLIDYRLRTRRRRTTRAERYASRPRASMKRTT